MSFSQQIFTFGAANPLLLDQLLAPANEVLSNFVRGVTSEGPLNDFRFLRLGVQRIVSQCASGRDFLQQLHNLHDQPIARATFFDALHSERRNRILAELNTQLVLRRASQLPDLLQGFPALAKYQIFAIDGHHLAHSVHAARDEKGDHVSANSLYAMNLRTGVLANLGSVQGEGVRRHEMPVFRRQLGPWLLRQTDRRGPPTICVVDPGFVDNRFWLEMLAAPRPALLITRTKSNMKPIVLGERLWERDTEVNQGVVADETISFDGRNRMRRVRYVDPESGEAFDFLTTVMDLSPGLVALLYLLRWRIEKVFDTSKNKLAEVKAWATGEVAQEMQAHFFALTHNLLLLLRQKLNTEHGIREEKVERKREESLTQRQEKATQHGRTVARFQEKLPAIVQLTAQFIRALRNGIIRALRWTAALSHFRIAMKAYL